MLARVAENIYWLARYLERAENTARLISVNANLLLDLQRGYELGWRPLVDITGSRHGFDAQKRRNDEREVVQFLLADAENPGSVSASRAASIVLNRASDPRADSRSSTCSSVSARRRR